MELPDLCTKVRELALETGSYIKREQGKLSSPDIRAKGLHNYVTSVDTAAERMIVDHLSGLLPESGFVAEEGTGNRKGDRFNWIIDPIDGTTNFIHGQPPYAISIALADGQEIVLGVVYEVCLDECYYAWKGSRAYLNEKPIQVSNAGKVSQSLIATGFPYTNFEHIRGFMQSFKYFLRHSHGVRRLGSAATDMAYVACGRFEAFYEYGLQAWDVAAASLILRQAGGKIGDFTGGDNWLYGKEIVASNAGIYDEFLDIINQIMVQEKILID